MAESFEEFMVKFEEASDGIETRELTEDEKTALLIIHHMMSYDAMFASFMVIVVKGYSRAYNIGAVPFATYVAEVVEAYRRLMNL